MSITKILGIEKKRAPLPDVASPSPTPTPTKASLISAGSQSTPEPTGFSSFIATGSRGLKKRAKGIRRSLVGAR